jgi:hypothetical protein
MAHRDGFLGGSGPEAAFPRLRLDLHRADASLPAQPELGALGGARRDEAEVAIARALAALRFVERWAARVRGVPALALKQLQAMAAAP